MNVVVDDFDTPLSFAVETGNLDLVDFLVADGADIDHEVPCMQKGTVLHQACMVQTNFFSI